MSWIACRKSFIKLTVVVLLIVTINSVQLKFFMLGEMKCNIFCRDPQPRTILVRDLVGLGNTSKTSPHMAIFHRCEESGCCRDNNEVCSPNKKENITFEYVEISSITETLIKTKTVENHTDCSCNTLDGNRAGT
ncbi:hypothetical protein JTB14_006859 [Gonioctena quinquepunctata]|nr:hypothetical protein JTB14_006859 [Gonioctena quinquepunctata]